MLEPADRPGFQSAHELLWGLFCSEIGLIEATTAQAQMAGLRSCFAPLKAHLLAADGQDIELRMGERSVSVGWVDDAVLFWRLYDKRHGDCGESLLERHVYPLIGMMLKETPVLGAAAWHHLESSIWHGGPGMASRILSRLPAFGLQELASRAEALVRDMMAEPAAMAA